MTERRLSKKEELPVGKLIGLVMKELGLARQLNERRIFAAWDAVSGAAAHTVSQYFRDGILYCGIGSSVLRSGLWMRKAEILEKMNAFLAEDELYIKDLRPVKRGPSGTNSDASAQIWVRDIVLR